MAKIPNVSGAEFSYLGRFRSEEFLRAGHNAAPLLASGAAAGGGSAGGAGSLGALSGLLGKDEEEEEKKEEEKRKQSTGQLLAGELLKI